jgi:hypothetical protein
LKWLLKSAPWIDILSENTLPRLLLFGGTALGGFRPVAPTAANGPTWWNSGPGKPGGTPHDGACFFANANFSGDYFCEPRGSVLNVPRGFNDKISSIRVYGRVRMTLYNDANYQGFSTVARQSVPDLRAWRVQGYSNKDWNNRISSMRLD